MITVMGAAGNTGSKVAAKLLDAGETIRVLGRSAEKIKPLADRGAEVMTGDVSDAAYLTRAFRGADAVYALIPANLQAKDILGYYTNLGEPLAKAVAESGVKHLVFLSSIGADQPSGTGPVVGLHEQEKRLRAIPDINVLALRPGYFYENLFGSLGMIKHMGINGGAIKGDLSLALTATDDIADAAVKALRSRDFKGFTVRELHGPRDITMDEVTRILGAKIGKSDLKYVTFPYADFAKALTQVGISESVATSFAEMGKSLNDGKMKPLEKRSAANTTPTRFEDFADVLAKAYAAVT